MALTFNYAAFFMTLTLCSSVFTKAFPPLLPCERDLRVGTRIMANDAIESDRKIFISILDSDEEALQNNSQAVLTPNEQLILTLQDWPTSSTEGFVFEIQTDCPNKPTFVDGDCGGSRKDGDFNNKQAIMIFPYNTNCIVKVIAAYSTGFNIPVEITKPFILPVD